jgi:DNA-binding NtrC family response regulator
MELPTLLTSMRESRQKSGEFSIMKEYIKILVADDETVIRNLLVHNLETEGYKVSAAQTEIELTERLQNEKFDLLLLDMKLPGRSGIEILREVKSNYPNLIVVIMTGDGEAYTLKEALKNGADEYVTKPFKSHEISLIIERAYWRMYSTETAKTS